MKNYCCILLLVFLVSCKTKKAFVDSKPLDLKEVKLENKQNPETIIQNYYNNKNDFSTLYIRSSVKYSDDKQSQNVSAEIKIKKDEKILVSIRFLGITMAKALITPNSVQYYEKINGKYFEGDYKSLSNWLGTDLDFIKIQNLLTGRAIDDLSKEKFTMLLVDATFKLSANDNQTKKNFFFNSTNFLLQKQEIVQPVQERMFEANYRDFQDFNSMILPSNLKINAVQKNVKTVIEIEYNSVSLNEDLSFPYNVPDGYDRIFIN